MIYIKFHITDVSTIVGVHVCQAKSKHFISFLNCINTHTFTFFVYILFDVYTYVYVV